MAEPAETLIPDQSMLWLPGLGMSVDSDQITSIHTFHLEFDNPCWSLTRFIEPSDVRHHDGTIIVSDSQGGRLRIDLAYVHCLLITAIEIEGEKRVTLQIYDMLGQRVFTLTSPQVEFITEWHQLCQSYFT